jgi:hypothetical protein
LKASKADRKFFGHQYSSGVGCFIDNKRLINKALSDCFCRNWVDFFYSLLRQLLPSEQLKLLPTLLKGGMSHVVRANT